MGNLHLFTEVIPFLRPCLVPSLPFPVVEQPTPQMSGTAVSTSSGKPSSQLLPDDSQPKTKVAGAKTPTVMQATPTSSVPNQSTPLSGHQRLQLKGGPKLLSCAPAPIVGGSKGANNAVVHVAPSHKPRSLVHWHLSLISC